MPDKKFYVYSKAGCGFCDKLTSFMDSHGIIYEKFTLGREYNLDDFLTKFGTQSTFPQVAVENQTIGGMKDTVRYIMKQQML